MRPPARIKKRLTIEKMFEWLQGASDEMCYKRRMAIWLTYTGELHANKVAEILGVSTQAVWLWISQYNSLGPAGLKRKGRGGRRWGFMTGRQESELLKPFIQKLRVAKIAMPAVIKRAIEEKLGHSVSKAYIYRLLQRHGWWEMIAQSKPVVKSEGADSFHRLSRPWIRGE